MKIKRIILIILLFIASFLLFGCGKEDKIERKIAFDIEEIEIIVGEEYIIDLNYVELSGEATFTLSNDNIELVDATIKGIKEGETTITAKLTFEEKEYSATLMVKVLPIPVTSIEISGKDRMIAANDRLNNQTLIATVLPAKAGSKELNWTSSDDSIATVTNKGYVQALKAGEVTITATSVITPSVSATFKITIVDTDTAAPVITLEEGTETLSVRIDEKYNLLSGVTAIDDFEGDVSDKVEVDTSEFNKYVPGTYDVYYSCKDEAGNESVKVKRTYTIVYDSYVQFIGHAGCYYGLMNSEEAFINAGKRGYQLVECDLKQTSDGVFVLSHDDDFNGTAINSITYANLKNITKTATRGGVSYTTTICTLERYLEICKEYGMIAVIELKSSNGITNSSQARMQALMNEIEKCGMLEQVVFLGSQYNCLIWVKEHGYDYIPCQYLVNSIESSDVLNRCNTYDLDISFNVDGGSNTEEWIMRYIDAGHKVSCWTFSQYSTAETLQKWINLNLIDYFTCDVLTAADVTLPKAKQVEEKTRYTVKFYDWDDTLLKTSSTVEGQKAVSPVDPKRDGYTFKEWDNDFSNVTSDLNVKAVYEVNTYNITYNPNNTQIEEKTFENKEAFVSEFYNDLFDWINANRDKMTKLTYNGGTSYTTVAKSSSASDETFSDVAGLRGLNVYIFEAAISAWMYKPIDGTNSKDYIPEEDNNYFLNTEPYRSKYINMNAYLLNCMETSYTGYNRQYGQASNNRVQIFFRFHQWCKGTNIPAFDAIPKYYSEGDALFEVTLPTSVLTYTVEDSIDLPAATADGKTFKEWNTKADGTGKSYTKIEKGTFGNLILYAIFE